MSGCASVGRRRGSASRLPRRMPAGRASAGAARAADRDATGRALCRAHRRCRDPCALAVAAVLPALRAAGGAAPTPAAGAEGAALRLPDRRDRLRPGADHRPVLAHVHGAHLRGAARPTTTWRGRCKHASRTPPTAMPEVIGRLPRPSLPGPARASTSPTTRRSRASGASSIAARLRLLVQAPLRPALKSPQPVPARERRHPRPARAAPRGDRRRRSRSTTTARSRACARSTATRCRSSWREPRPRFTTTLADARSSGAVAREVVEAYGDRDHGAPGRHRAVPARRVAAQLAHRARAQPELPRAALRRASRRPTTPTAQAHRRSASRAGACRWSTGSRSAIIEETQPRWLSFLNGEHGHRSSACRTSSPTSAIPNNKLAPNLAKRGIQMYRVPRADVTLSLLQHGGSGGRRLHAREGGAAPRDRARPTTSSARSACVRRGQAIPAQAIVPPLTVGLRPDVQDRDERLRPGRGAARCSTCTATSTATATAGASSPTASRWCSSTRPSPTSSRASSTSCGRRTWTRSASASSFKTAQVAREPEGRARRQADDVGRRLVAPRARRRGRSWTCCYGPNKGQANHARFELPAFDELYERQQHAARRARARRRCSTRPSS